MNAAVIVLGIVLVVLIYVLYLYLSPTYSSLISSVSLLTNNPSIKNITNPTSPRYAYGFWLYINSWSNNNVKTILYRNNNIKLNLDTTQLNLYADVYMGNNGTYTNWYSQIPGNDKNGILITNNFPMQKWCFIVLSIDSNFLDCYLDGKLILSQKLYATVTEQGSKTPINVFPAVPPDVPSSATAGAAIVLGGYDTGGTNSKIYYTNFDAAINKFYRWPNAVNPQTVWDTYMMGNGTTFSGLSSFNAQLNILRNNAAYTSLSLF